MVGNCIWSKYGRRRPDTAGNVPPLRQGEVRVVRGEVWGIDHLAERSEQSGSGEREDGHFCCDDEAEMTDRETRWMLYSAALLTRPWLLPSRSHSMTQLSEVQKEPFRR